MERILNVIAALITIINFFLAFINASPIENQFGKNINFNLSGFSVGIRITITVILELCLASFFGYSMCYLAKKLGSNAASILIVVVIIALLSAWVSFFNIEFVLLAGAELKGFWMFFGLFFLFLIAYFIASFLINIHSKQFKIDDPYIIMAIQAIAFLLIYIGAIID